MPQIDVIMAIWGFLLYDCTLAISQSEMLVSLGWPRQDPFVPPAASTPYLRVPVFSASLIAILPCQVSSIGTIRTRDGPCLSRPGPVQDETDRESRARYDREQNTLRSNCNQLRKISPDDRPVGVSIVIQQRPVQCYRPGCRSKFCSFPVRCPFLASPSPNSLFRRASRLVARTTFSSLLASNVTDVRLDAPTCSVRPNIHIDPATASVPAATLELLSLMASPAMTI